MSDTSKLGERHDAAPTVSAENDLIRELRDEAIYDPVRHQAAAIIERLTKERDDAEAALAKAREALEDIEKVSAEDHIKAIARAALHSMKEQDG